MFCGNGERRAKGEVATRKQPSSCPWLIYTSVARGGQGAALTGASVMAMD